MGDEGWRGAGFRLIRSFVAPDELTALTALVAEALAASSVSGCSRPGNDLRPLRWSDDVIAFMLGSRSRVSRLRDRLGATDLKWISGYLSIKPPFSPPLAWHQDWWCWDHPMSMSSVPLQVALLCYLTETDASNGALRLLPGSHRRATALHRALPEAHAEASHALATDHLALADAAGQVSPRLRAGDAIVLDYRLLHGTYPNHTEHRRDCIILSFAPDWRALPPDIRSHLIQHPALPGDDERAASARSGYGELLPRFDGERRSLNINRVPPADFSMVVA